MYKRAREADDTVVALDTTTNDDQHPPPPAQRKSAQQAARICWDQGLPVQLAPQVQAFLDANQAYTDAMAELAAMEAAAAKALDAACCGESELAPPACPEGVEEARFRYYLHLSRYDSDGMETSGAESTGSVTTEGGRCLGGIKKKKPLARQISEAKRRLQRRASDREELRATVMSYGRRGQMDRRYSRYDDLAYPLHPQQRQSTTGKVLGYGYDDGRYQMHLHHQQQQQSSGWNDQFHRRNHHNSNNHHKKNELYSRMQVSSGEEEGEYGEGAYMSTTMRRAYRKDKEAQRRRAGGLIGEESDPSSYQHPFGRCRSDYGGSEDEEEPSSGDSPVRATHRYRHHPFDIDGMDDDEDEEDAYEALEKMRRHSPYRGGRSGGGAWKRDGLGDGRGSPLRGSHSGGGGLPPMPPRGNPSPFGGQAPPLVLLKRKNPTGAAAADGAAAASGGAACRYSGGSLYYS